MTPASAGSKVCAMLDTRHDSPRADAAQFSNLKSSCFLLAVPKIKVCSPILCLNFGWSVQGVAEGEVAAEVARVLTRVALPAEMAARPAGEYSGGSRRKLALGIALVGGVDAVLLDEPSSGMVSLHKPGKVLIISSNNDITMSLVQQICSCRRKDLKALISPGDSNVTDAPFMAAICSSVPELPLSSLTSEKQFFCNRNHSVLEQLISRASLCLHPSFCS